MSGSGNGAVKVWSITEDCSLVMDSVFYGDTGISNFVACSEYLKKEFGLLNILLGNNVTQQALGKDVKVSTHAYKIITKGPCHFIVTHHYSQLDYAQLEKVLQQFLSRYSNQL